MARAMLFATLLLLPVVTSVEMEVRTGHADDFHFPAGLTDHEEIEKVLAKGPDTDGAAFADLPFHFDMPFDDFDGMNSFLVESVEAETEAKVTPTDPVEVGRDDFGDEPPVLCETICRPINSTEAENAAKDAKRAEEQYDQQRIKAEAAENAVMPPTTGVPAETGMGPATVLLEVEKRICTGKGGKWHRHPLTRKHSCHEFMQTSATKVKYDPLDIFKTCATEFGAEYAPCNPYQALALAHLYNVPDQEHYWLWPGGRAEQVKQAAMKQEIGNNPVTGLDKCPAGRHVGFFHNWDATHVDSWGCLDDSMELPVLCCRMKKDPKKKAKK